MLVPPSDPPAIVQPAPVRAHDTVKVGRKTVRFSCKQMRRLWVDNGGPKHQQDEAAAVGYAESGGHRYARHQNAPGNVDKGVWQINDFYWPGRSTYNVTRNVRAAIYIYNRDGWSAWSSVAAGHEHGKCGYR